MDTLTTTELKNRIGETLDDVQFRGKRVILARKGRPAAALISMEDLRLLEELEDRLDADEIERLLADPHEEWTPLADVLAESERLP
ncbi:MAG: type II toxin-antitoxin system Phd/YefM family antitoxin [Armatimonadetes bacterium]|nr:type II toxin-antitoxin system Phd/YefM family antitoxin [Armatimonadota bacterium]